MDNDLAQEAINAALHGEWKKAVSINLQILDIDQNNSDALNRLARSYAELGDLTKAKSTCLRVLKSDPFNTIAKRSLDKWKALKKGDTYISGPSNPDTFLEEPGRTKVVTLLFPGSPKLLAKLDTADEVRLDTHSHRVTVVTMDGRYVGRLPDDLSARIKHLVKFGNVYQAYIKSVSVTDVKIFVREVQRGKKVSEVPSFTAERIDYVSFTPPELVHGKSTSQNMEEEE